MKGEKQKGFVLVMAMLFMLIINAVITSVLMRQTGQYVETSALSRQKFISQCADLAFEAVLASIFQLNVQNVIQFTAPGLRLYTGHIDTGPERIPIAGSETSIGQCGNLLFAGANVTSETGGCGSMGIPLTPTVTCIDPLTGAPFEIEMGIFYILP